MRTRRLTHGTFPLDIQVSRESPIRTLSRWWTAYEEIEDDWDTRPHRELVAATVAAAKP